MTMPDFLMESMPCFSFTDNYFMTTKDDTTHNPSFFYKCLFPVLYN